MSETSKPTINPEYRLVQNPLRHAIAGGLAMYPFVVAAWGWASSWNAYINLTFTLAGLLFWIVLAVTYAEGR